LIAEHRGAMSETAIPEEVRRFIVTSLPTVPHLEALLLLRSDAAAAWDSAALARRLYIGERNAARVLADLHDGGFLIVPQSRQPMYSYKPAVAAQAVIVDQLAEIYAHHLVEVTNLIHSRSALGAQLFADAFKIRKD
jgi:hypothetical protein